jgi:hypothetical protein
VNEILFAASQAFQFNPVKASTTALRIIASAIIVPYERDRSAALLMYSFELYFSSTFSIVITTY